jgi:hypothetical protein
MNHPRRPLLLLAALALTVFTGCSSRPEAVDVTLIVNSVDSGTTSTFTATVTVDGMRTEIPATSTPWRGTYQGVQFDGEFRTASPGGLHIEASVYDKPATLSVQNKVHGASGGSVRVFNNTSADGRAGGVQIAAFPLPAPASDAVPAKP